MQLSLPFIDIIIFAVIAIFLIYRLKSILGQNSEGNEQSNNPNIQSKKTTNVVKLDDKKLDINYSKIDKNTIITIDPTFNENDFLKGAQNFFKMVIDSFVKGNLKDVIDFIDNKLIKNFQSVINERLEEKETLLINIIKMNSVQIRDIKRLKNYLRITVLLKLIKLKFINIKKAK